jgi:hypothetical protein
VARDQIKTALSQILSKTPFVPSYSQLTPPRVIECKVLPPVQWERSTLELALNLKLPEDVLYLWEIASEVRLYDDVNYGQWGCILWSPSEIVARHRSAIAWRGPDSFRSGDLIIGEFRGDTDLVVLRCDPSQQDFESVVIALGMDPRDEWPCVASSIAEFVVAFLSHPVRKFWEPPG